MKNKVLHVGCGYRETGVLHKSFNLNEWEEIRLDINPDVNPDIVGSILDLSMIEDGSMNSVFSYHNIEHVNNYNVDKVLQEFNRVLCADGQLFIVVPNIYMAIENLLSGDLEKTIFETPKGPVNVLSLLYGFDPIAIGNDFQVHKTAFSKKRFEDILPKQNFANIIVWIENDGFDLCVTARKVK